jgi:hypothetical protein
MNKYQIYGKIKSQFSDVTATTNEFVKLITKTKKIQLRSFYEKQMNNIKLQTYERKQYNSASKSEMRDAVIEDLRDEANHRYFSLTGHNADLVNKFVDDNKDKAVNERAEALSEVEQLFNNLEDETEAIANEKYQQEYDNQCAQFQSFIDGDEAIVVAKLDQTFDTNGTEIRLPFDATIKIDYLKDKGKAVVDIDIPTYLGIPTQKVNVSATYGRVSLKDKLVRELDDENSKTIIGLAFYIASFVFDVSPNINIVELSIWSGGFMSGLLWIRFDRSKFSGIRPLSTDPLGAIFNWTYVCNIKVVRGGTRIDPIERNLFRKQINEQRENIS